MKMTKILKKNTINGYVYVEKISQFKELSMAYNILHVVMKREGV